MVRSFVITVPAAWEIQDGDDQQPHEINARQIKSKPRWLEKERLTRGNDLAGFVAHCKKNNNVQNPDEVNMQCIIEEWHIAEHDQYRGKLIPDVFNKGKHYQGRPYRHA